MSDGFSTFPPPAPPWGPTGRAADGGRAGSDWGGYWLRALPGCHPCDLAPGWKGGGNTEGGRRGPVSPGWGCPASPPEPAVGCACKASLPVSQASGLLHDIPGSPLCSGSSPSPASSKPAPLAVEFRQLVDTGSGLWVRPLGFLHPSPTPRPPSGPCREPG